MKLTKKQRLAIESIREEVQNILIENSLLAKENNWDFTKIELRSTYDSFRILNIIHGKFK